MPKWIMPLTDTQVPTPLPTLAFGPVCTFKPLFVYAQFFWGELMGRRRVAAVRAMSVNGAADFRRDRVHTRVGTYLFFKCEYAKGVPTAHGYFGISKVKVFFPVPLSLKRQSPSISFPLPLLLRDTLR